MLKIDRTNPSMIRYLFGLRERYPFTGWHPNERTWWMLVALSGVLEVDGEVGPQGGHKVTVTSKLGKSQEE